MSGARWPECEGDWFRYAAALKARMARLQLHVEPDWLFAVCSECGWDLECSRPEISAFRFEVASHQCEAPAPVPESVPAAVEVLF